METLWEQFVAFNPKNNDFGWQFFIMLYAWFFGLALLMMKLRKSNSRIVRYYVVFPLDVCSWIIYGLMIRYTWVTQSYAGLIIMCLYPLVRFFRKLIPDYDSWVDKQVEKLSDYFSR